jgi:cobalt-zinc-cadmium efflux system membrane fusion protein
MKKLHLQNQFHNRPVQEKYGCPTSGRLCQKWDSSQNGIEAADAAFAPEGRLIIARRFQRRVGAAMKGRPVGTPEPSPQIWGRLSRIFTALLFTALALLAACSRETPVSASKPPVTLDPDVFTADHPELFKTATAELRQLPTQVTANGVVSPDVNRTIHVTSLGAGRVVDLKVRLGDTVRKGQTLLTISSPDLASSFADYEKARADEALSRKALDRAQMLYDRGAIAAKDLEVAQDAEDKAKVDMETADHKVRILGGDPAKPSPLLELKAPVDGTIVEQNVAGAEGIKSLDNSPNLFTIANLGQVWVVCDVFENDLGEVHLGDSAEIRLNAFPDRVFKGKVADISRVLDPNTRSAKVRIVLPNPDRSLRISMFAVATFRSRKLTDRIVVPSTAIMRLHDKDWVFRKEGPDQFRKIAVNADGLAPDGMQEIRAGVKSGDELVANALEFSTEVAEKRAGQ